MIRIGSTTTTMSISELISVQRELLSMEAQRSVKARAVESASDAMDLTPMGYKATIARLMLRDATQDLSKHDADVAALTSKLQEASETKIWFARRYAQYLIRRDALQETKRATDQQLATTLEEEKKGAWKWKGGRRPTDSAAVATLREHLVAIDAATKACEAEHKDTLKIIEEYRSTELRDAEFVAWTMGGPKPEFIRKRQEEEHSEREAGCVTLKRQPRMVFIPPTEEEEPSDWICMTIDQYLESLTPKPVEEIVDTYTQTTTSLSPHSWIPRLIKAQRARRLQAQSAPSAPPTAALEV